MKVAEIKDNLNKNVKYISNKTGINGEYRLTGAIFRKGEKGFYYQVELQDLKSRSIIICGLDDITAIEK